MTFADEMAAVFKLDADTLAQAGVYIRWLMAFNLAFALFVVLSAALPDLVRTVGTVIDASTGKAIGDATVMWQGKHHVSTVSGTNGRFVLHTDRRHAGTLKVTREGFEASARDELYLSDGIVVRLKKRDN